MSNEKLLQLRKELKERIPKFYGQDSHKRKEVGKAWRKPKGLHSKIRHSFRGKLSLVRVGYMLPKALRGLTDRGMKVFIVRNKRDFELAEKAEDTALVISSQIGAKKKVALLKKAKENGMLVLNFRDVDSYLKRIDEELIKKNTVKKESQKKKEERKKELEKKAEKAEAKELDKKIEEEDLKKKKEEEKKELDKLLTKRE